MRFIDAFWEKRNLGVDSLEVEVEDKDFILNPAETEKRIFACRDDKGYAYIVVKVPEGHVEYDYYLQHHGWWKIESQIELVTNAKTAEAETRKYENILDGIDIEEIDQQSQVDAIKQEIERGIFQTDRIALDPSFGVGVAGKRYANWVQDEFECGSSLSYGIVDGEKVSFALARYNGASQEGLLGGLFCMSSSRQMAGLIEAFRMRKAIRQGIKHFHTFVSSNNVVVLKLHEAMGYRVKSIKGVYVRHF